MNSFVKFFICCILLLAFSCSEDPEVSLPTSYKLITGNTKKSWKITTLEWTGDGKKGVTYSLPGCLKDDLYIFYNNSSRLYEVTNGSLKCDPTDQDKIVSDEWSFVNATATLNIIQPLFSDSSLPFYVKKLTAKEMVLEIYTDQDNKYSYKITMQSVSEE
jgi:hypothetical protein